MCVCVKGGMIVLEMKHCGKDEPFLRALPDKIFNLEWSHFAYILFAKGRGRGST